ncbi:cell adhesion molecule 1 isoform X1 [Salmo trutta]|uniref:cell adhesion molecule 1 isoform X1 n=1 Tax=Salmo trutta TaxID=8032 RepID=UPI0011306CCA|nr:cell adhesion molecule 1-like isoform X1 [Salmo trutta]
MKASTTAGPALPMTSPETFEQGIIEVVTRLVTQNFTEHFTQPFRAGVLTTTSADMTETTSDTFLGVLTTTSADMTETTSDTFLVLTTPSADMTETTSVAFLVGAANVDDGSFEAIIFGGGIFVLLLALLLALLVLRYIVKHKGTYHTNEAECGDSVDKYGSDSQSEQVQLEILDKEE